MMLNVYDFIKKINFKRPIPAGIVIIVCLLLFNSCEPKTGTPIKEIKIGDINYKILSRDFAKTVTPDSESDSAKKYYLIVDLSVRNDKGEKIKFDSGYFKLKDKNVATYPYSKEGEDFFQGAKSSILDAVILPNDPTKGMLIFLVPEIKNYQLLLSDGSLKSEMDTVLIEK
jgi:hypothetical protein